jgi:GNAT superfamily N-acetyltransferase
MLRRSPASRPPHRPGSTWLEAGYSPPLLVARTGVKVATAARPSGWKRVDGLCGITRLNLVTAKAEVRPASDADLATLVAVLGERHFFTDRLARQQRGGGVLLVAWLDGRPVGEVFLACEPAEEPEVRRHLPGVPRLDHLEVVGPFQGRGIGTALIRAAEATAPPARARADRAGRGAGQPQGSAAV